MIKKLHSLVYTQMNCKRKSIQKQHKEVYRSFIYDHQNLREPRYSSIVEWINKLHYFQTMDYYSFLSGHGKTWKNLKCVLLSRKAKGTRLCIVCLLLDRQISFFYHWATKETQASQMALVAKNPHANAGDVRDRFDSWVGKIPWRRA